MQNCVHKYCKENAWKKKQKLWDYFNIPFKESLYKGHYEHNWSNEVMAVFVFLIQYVLLHYLYICVISFQII